MNAKKRSLPVDGTLQRLNNIYYQIFDLNLISNKTSTNFTSNITLLKYFSNLIYLNKIWNYLKAILKENKQRKTFLDVKKFFGVLDC